MNREAQIETVLRAFTAAAEATTGVYSKEAVATTLLDALAVPDEPPVINLDNYSAMKGSTMFVLERGDMRFTCVLTSVSIAPCKWGPHHEIKLEAVRLEGGQS